MNVIMTRARKRRMIPAKVKKQLLAELLVPGCVVSDLAKSSGISRSTLHKWRVEQNQQQEAASSVNCNPHFVELKVASATLPTKSILTKALLVFEDFSISLEGNISGSKVCAIFKVLEEPC